ncbi:effector-associated domain EAD1-containing protein [Aeromonas caviae]|uniref:Effector-associated domain EAD1-containing protein n=1 Tax=Aeromonas caviae TaxID=648 RepID=A0AAJ5ZC97_AERCA|nr:effector-associated domain EAD1-containing protein [Aeromonas caviae]WFF97503.1 effector-associated domain EAD1-containing protein [Aeromonas caviae]
MRVEQALYGETRGGHGLRLASTDLSLISELTSRLDLPDTAPPGVNWSPFVSGFPYGEHYVLARTFADPAATRPGMVLSHAVIAPLDDVVKMSDLRPLFALLITEPISPEALVTCELPAFAEPPTPAPELVSLAEALVTRGVGPVVRVGLQGFDELILALWTNLWPEVRAQFAFRLSFGPQDIVDSPMPSLIYTPNELASRWRTHRVIGAANSSSPSLAAKILCGEAGAAQLLTLAQRLGARISHFTDLPLLQRIYEIDSSPNPRFDECVSVLRVLERLSPAPDRGAASKAKFIQKLESRMPNASVQEILLLRNLSTIGLSDSARIWDSFRAWVALSPLAQHEDADMLSVVSDALSPSAAVEPWRQAVLDGLVESASLASSTSFANAFWRWAKLHPAAVAKFADYLPVDGELDRRLADAVPQVVNLDTGNAVMAIAQSKHWLQLHGVAASACLAPREAVTRQLSIDTVATSLDGLRASLRCTSPNETIELALALALPRLLRIAAERVADDPPLLGGLSFAIRPAQDLWFYALLLNTEAWKGPLDPQSSFFTVIQNLLDGAEVNMDLIDTLSCSPLADLGEFTCRTDAWRCLPARARVNCLRATAAGWIQRALMGDVSTPDRELETTILDADGLEIALQLVVASAGQVVRIIGYLPNFNESRCLLWLDDQALLRSLPAADAQALGRLILSRRWQRAANRLVQLALQGRSDVKHALSECQTMIDLLSRWWLGVLPASDVDKWTVLEELAVNLYPNGPDDSGLWDRAGGQDADLKSYASGRTRWHDAISKLRRGRGPRVGRLLEAMRIDYPSNDQLRALLASRMFSEGFNE